MNTIINMLARDRLEEGDTLYVGGDKIAYKVTRIHDQYTITVRRSYMKQFHQAVKYVVILGLVGMGLAAIYYSGLYDLVISKF